MDDYNMRMIVVSSQYFYEHFQVCIDISLLFSAFICPHGQCYEIKPIVLTNTKKQQLDYSKSEHVFCLTITELVDSVKERYPDLSDHLNIASIENGNRPTGANDEQGDTSSSSSSSSHVRSCCC